MAIHIKWTEIESFHNIRKYTAAYPQLLGGNSKVTYRGKVKLHGTNAAIQVLADGTVLAQSRTSVITSTSDNAGFAKWVEENKEHWSNLTTSYYPNQLNKKYLGSSDQSIVVFGEWCGPGIQKGVAVNQISKKIFAVFAVQALPGDELIVDPEVIQELIQHSPDTYVLPWYGEEINVNWFEPAEELEKAVALINLEVAKVEKCDPWVQAIFGVEGVGEGIVYYPVSHPGRKAFGDLCFKAKGDEHKNVKTAKPAQVDPVVVEGASAFAALVVTEARLEQGARAINDNGELVFDLKNMGKFIGWISKDVVKECTAELEASGLTWDKHVQKQVGDTARIWYLDKCKSL